MSDRPPIPEPLWHKLTEILKDMRESPDARGGAITLRVNPAGLVTALEVQRRYEVTREEKEAADREAVARRRSE